MRRIRLNKFGFRMAHDAIELCMVWLSPLVHILCMCHTEFRNSVIFSEREKFHVEFGFAKKKNISGFRGFYYHYSLTRQCHRFFFFTYANFHATERDYFMKFMTKEVLMNSNRGKPSMWLPSYLAYEKEPNSANGVITNCIMFGSKWNLKRKRNTVRWQHCKKI